MPVFEELLMKVANNETLAPLELERLRQEAKTLEDVSTFVKSFQGSGKILDSFIDFPIEVIYSSVLEQDTASIKIEIPSSYKHLLIMGAAEESTGGVAYMLGQFNGDSGTNYVQQKFYASTTNLVGEYNASQTGALVGTCSPNSAFISIIPHYNSTIYKNVIMLAHHDTVLFLVGSQWQNTGAISSITFSSVTNNILNGAALSIYGVK